MTSASLRDTMLANASHRRPLALPTGRTIPMVCDRPFAEAATDLLRSAIRACKPVPSVLGSQQRPLRAHVPSP